MPTLTAPVLSYPFELEFDEKIHAYKIDGVFVPGVTSILDILSKPALIPWAAKMTADHIESKWVAGKAYQVDELRGIVKEGKSAWRKKKDAAADKGTSAHNLIEAHIKTGKMPEVPEDEQIKSCIAAFMEWEKANKVEWLASEVRVGSSEHMFAGTLDAVAVVNGKHTLIDFKTSNGIYESMYLQVAGYYIGWEAGAGAAFDERIILRFPKDGKGFESRTIPTPYEQDKRAFLAILQAYKCLRDYTEFIR